MVRCGRPMSELECEERCLPAECHQLIERLRAAWRRRLAVVVAYQCCHLQEEGRKNRERGREGKKDRKREKKDGEREKVE